MYIENKLINKYISYSPLAVPYWVFPLGIPRKVRFQDFKMGATRLTGAARPVGQMASLA